MLIFKSNIYQSPDATEFLERAEISLWPEISKFNFIQNSLKDDLDFFKLLQKSSGGIIRDDLVSFYPQSHRFGDSQILQGMVLILLDALLDKNTWFRMNTYHFCLLYDSLIRHAYNYNHDSLNEKIALYPEMKGKSIRTDLIINKLFFNTVFLMDNEKYASMTGDEKKQAGLTCPCQFGVINGLRPAPDEIKLKIEPGFPYSITV